LYREAAMLHPVQMEPLEQKAQLEQRMKLKLVRLPEQM
jgi:hypothetical protein